MQLVKCLAEIIENLPWGRWLVSLHSTEVASDPFPRPRGGISFNRVLYRDTISVAQYALHHYNDIIIAQMMY